MKTDFLKKLGIKKKNSGSWTGTKSSGTGTYID
jgi:hypothetical protein